MTPRPWKLRSLLFLYSNANIVGCTLALAGPALLFTGLIGPLWLLITAALYAAGYLLAPRAPELERRIADTLGVDETLAQLDRVIAQARPHLSDELTAHLDGVRGSVVEVLPRLVGQGTGSADLFTVRETVLRYLPESLANYVALPPAFRGAHVLKDGKTARQLLGDQLALLDAKLREIVANVASSDAQALLANGRFLEAKFRPVDFLAA